MKRRRLIPICLFAFAAACGGNANAPVEAELQLIDRQEAKITVTPALEVSSLVDDGLASRIIIDQIDLNLTEVRLLGADPSIPAGGLELLDAPRVIQAEGDVEAALELQFPEQYLGDEDLAVYLRIDRSIALEQASLVIRGRLFTNPVDGGASALTADIDPDGATDPDIDPADDPDGDGTDCATDPDIDPADCAGMSTRGLVQRGLLNPSVGFELRDRNSADLVSQLGDAASLDVVVGIPANRWFTPSVVNRLEEVLATESVGGVVNDTEKTTRSENAVIVEAEAAANSRGGACSANAGMNGCRDDVFLTDVREGLKVRR